MMSRYQSGGAYKRKLEALTRTRSLFKITEDDRGGLEEANCKRDGGMLGKKRRTSCQDSPRTNPLSYLIFSRRKNN